MATEEEIAAQLALLDSHRRRLSIRLNQRALLGSVHVSPEVILDILSARQHIRQIKHMLRTWDVEVEPHPDDEDQTTPTEPQRKLAVTDFLWPDGSILILLPIRLDKGNALCVSKHPVTNRQYKRFVNATQQPAPRGEHYVSGKMVGPFEPWADPRFAQDDQPVVCVSYDDADAYCRWVNTLVGQHNRAVATHQNDAPAYPYPRSSTRLPTTMEWDFAAYGTVDPIYTATWLNCQKEIVHHTFAPEPIDTFGIRTNRLGLTDMIGNAWEWCASAGRIAAAVLGSATAPEGRGGGFIDDLTRLSALPSIPKPRETRHADIGFRIAVELVFADLADEDQAQVARFPPLAPWS